MARIFRLAAIAVIVSSTLLVAASQQSRDAAAPSAMPISGTGVVRGAVVFDDSPPRPARRATVTLTCPDNGRALRTVTDDAGVFSFIRLPAGRYLLAATKLAQVTVVYGASKPGLPGSAIVVADGKTFDTGTLTMSRGAVITGTVRGATGRLMANVPVQAVAFQVVDGQRQPLRTNSGSQTNTDDRGVFRIFGLAPGNYVVAVQTRFSFFNGELALATDAEYRFAAGASGTPVPAPSPSVTYAPEFFPGVSDESLAEPVSLRAGEERAGVDIRMQLVRTATVSGTIVGAPGEQFITAVRMQSPGGALFGDLSGGAGMVSRGSVDGAFKLTGVAPGSYVLMAAAALLRPDGTPPQSPTLFASTDVEVSGADITGLTLPLQPMVKLKGSVVYENPSGKSIENATGAIRLLSDKPLLVPAMPSGNIGTDGAFTIEGIVPGVYRVAAQFFGNQFGPQMSGWTAKSAMLNGRDLLDRPLEIRPGVELPPLVVTMTERMAEIAGTIIDGAGNPAPRFYVHVFPTDRTLWLSNSRRIKNARASTDGKFAITGLPAGEYYVSALTEYDPATLSDPSFLEPLVAASIKITLADGEKKIQTLKLAGG